MVQILGTARLATKVNELRNINPNHTLFLNAGDYYQGQPFSLSENGKSFHLPSKINFRILLSYF